MQHSQNERLVYFSDAVIAITITLLVLEIRLPEGVGEMSDSALAGALSSLGPQLRGYLISFAVIGTFWVSHHQKFAVIPRSRRELLFANLMFLAAIGLMPLVTGLISENPGRLATQLYAGLMAVTAACLTGIWALAMRADLIASEVSQAARRRSLAFSALSVVILLLSIPLAALDADAAKLSWLLLLPVTLAQRPFRADAEGAAA